MKLSERMQKLLDYQTVLHEGNVDPVVGEWIGEVAELEAEIAALKQENQRLQQELYDAEGYDVPKIWKDLNDALLKEANDAT